MGAGFWDGIGLELNDCVWIEYMGLCGSSRLIDFGNQKHNTTHRQHHTDNKDPTSPTTNLPINPAQAYLTPNVHARGMVIEFKEAKEREWQQMHGHGHGP